MLAVLLAWPLVLSAGAQSASTPEVIRIPWSRDDGSLTPFSFQTAYPLMTLVYDTLLWHDEDGVPQLWLANSIEWSADNTVLTLKLADGARWHDGMPLTSADVVATFKVFTDNPRNAFIAELTQVADVSAPDASTVRIRLKRPSPGFLYYPLADMPILPKHIWESATELPAGAPTGSGPYRVTDYHAGGYRFEAVADYFRGAPLVKTIVVQVIPSLEERLRLLDRRQVDMLPQSLPEKMASRTEGIGIKIARGPTYLGTALMFNTRRPPFDRVEVRRAISKALDLRRIAFGSGETVSADKGYIHPQSQWAPPVPVHIFDEKGARAELAGLGLPPIEVLAPSEQSIQLEAGRQVVLALQRVGIDAVLRELTGEELSREIGRDGEPPTFQAAISDLLPSASNDPDYLARVFGSDPETASLNYTGYQSAVFDRIADNIATATAPTDRLLQTAEALRVLAEDAPLVPLFFSGGAFAYRPAVYDGWVYMKGSGILDKRSFVEPRIRAPRPGPGLEAAVPSNSSKFRLAWVAAGLLTLLGAVALFRAKRR